MADFKLILLVAFFGMLALVESAGTNCGTGNACDGNPHKKLLQFRRMVNGALRNYAVYTCCKSGSEYFRIGVNKNADGSDSPWCTCDYDRMGGDCWKGRQCSACIKDAGSVNGMPVCCANCKKSGLALSSTSCNCLHN